MKSKSTCTNVGQQTLANYSFTSRNEELVPHIDVQQQSHQGAYTTQCDAVHDTETSTSIEVELVNPELIVCQGICCSIESDGPFLDFQENHFLLSKKTL